MSTAPSSNGKRNGRSAELALREPGRFSVAGLSSPHPLIVSLPASFQEDEFARRFVSAFDEVLAPIFSSLDNLDSYLDPLVSPEDFLEWLASWVGVELDENWPIERRRAFVQKAVELYRWRGTVKGLSEHIAIFTGEDPEILENGGMVWSTSPGTPYPGKAKPELVVRLRVKNPDSINVPRLERLVAASKPGHISAKVEVLPA